MIDPINNSYNNSAAALIDNIKPAQLLTSKLRQRNRRSL